MTVRKQVGAPKHPEQWLGREESGGLNWKSWLRELAHPWPESYAFQNLKLQRERSPRDHPPPSPGNTLGLVPGLDSFDVQLRDVKNSSGLPETQQKEKSRIANVKLPPSDRDYADGTESQKEKQKWPDTGVSEKGNTRRRITAPPPTPLLFWE